MKKNIIMIIITMICSMCLLLVMYYFKTKDTYYISNNNEINKNIELSMTKVENGETTEISETPTEGIYTFDYDCNGSANITWINKTHLLKVKVINTPTKCSLTFTKVPDKDINLVSIYVNGVQQATNFSFEANTNYYLTDYECYNSDGTANTNITVSWDKKSKTIALSSFNKQTYCDVHFKTTGITFYDEIINSEPAKSDISIPKIDLKGSATISSYSTDKNIQGLMYTADVNYGEDGNRVYYYRGAVDNNWVLFGGYYWRILRTTGEGGVKLIYSGDTADNKPYTISNSTSAYIKYTENISSAFIGATPYNSSCTAGTNGNHCIGYTYNSTSYTPTSSDTSSTIKNYIDTWYGNNLLSYNAYVSKTAVFCNHRQAYYTEPYINGTIDRLIANTHGMVDNGIKLMLSFSCPNNINPQSPFTLINASGSRYTAKTITGNGKLTYPVALISANEVYNSGILYPPGAAVSYYFAYPQAWLSTNASEYNWWSMTPAYNINDGNGTITHHILTIMGGGVGYVGNITTSSIYARPLIALKPCVTLGGGIGSYENPYTIASLSSGCSTQYE